MRTINNYGMVNYDTTEREIDFRRDLYRAIFAGNVDEAKVIANMMAMVDIDRELIWEARK